MLVEAKNHVLSYLPQLVDPLMQYELVRRFFPSAQEVLPLNTGPEIVTNLIVWGDSMYFDDGIKPPNDGDQPERSFDARIINFVNQYPQLGRWRRSNRAVVGSSGVDIVTKLSNPTTVDELIGIEGNLVLMMGNHGNDLRYALKTPLEVELLKNFATNPFDLKAVYMILKALGVGERISTFYRRSFETVNYVNRQRTAAEKPTVLAVSINQNFALIPSIEFFPAEGNSGSREDFNLDQPFARPLAMAISLAMVGIAWGEIARFQAQKPGVPMTVIPFSGLEPLCPKDQHLGPFGQRELGIRFCERIEPLRFLASQFPG